MNTRRSSSGQEIETKLRVPDIFALQARLKKLRAVQSSPRTYESNTLYDTRKKDLLRSGRMIRVRIEQAGSKAKRGRQAIDSPAILTFKGPPQTSGTSPDEAGQAGVVAFLKVREEREVTLSSWEQMASILLALGFRPVFRYEKFRTTYTLPGIRRLKVELDETPLGCFLELEGGAAAIDRAAKLLGYHQKDYIVETYGALYLEDCRRRHLKPSNMLFDSVTKSRS
jgi:adenylate cyclase, class 2